ncbi:helix-turn-helix transcriptional regulator [Bradyrhizobium manausense]|uniref:helix-turn-helix domain-containing protein n=1 Tax=Bradyrhizobium manausense TaxID=989370 RepID=UPI001BA8C935|nr:helix-turn-helix domain-containing protein [Bradyrhizobium manausense]MBR0686143.1 helix-turn-helix transcriptional regulator [Bradyrhizobium manausense]MBR0835884.1 helix-turn-helix transcriptional regulator [Bradyrhizobium manausense]
MEATALDLGLRGAVAGLFLMIVVVTLGRVRPLDTIKWLSVAMAASGALYAIVTAPFVPKLAVLWIMPVLGANPVLVWLWARASFDDDFVVRRWHGALWLAVVGVWFSVIYTWTTWPMFAKAGVRSMSILAIILALSAAVQTVRTWKTDLVAGRRRLRLAVLILSLLIVVLLSVPELTSISAKSFGMSGSLATAAGLLAIAALAGWGLFHPPPAIPAVVALAAATASENANRAAPVKTADGGRDATASLLLRRLDNLMTVERVYRQEGLTIGALAAKLDLPEYRLRQAINEGLGYRNFNAFLNRYRLDEAKAALSDPSQRDVAVLTIAMDAGFQSIGPFNRAFKAESGLTPTEFRRDALARSAAIALENDGNFRIGQSR